MNTMPEKLNIEEWEKEFDRRFRCVWRDEYFDKTTKEERTTYRSFISTLLKEEKEYSYQEGFTKAGEMYQEHLKEERKRVLEEVLVLAAGLQDDPNDWVEFKGEDYNQALSDLSSLIKEKLND